MTINFVSKLAYALVFDDQCYLSISSCYCILISSLISIVLVKRMDPPGLEFSLALSEAVKIMDLNSLKPKQVESIQSFASGKDTFVALPTGYGKSVIFAILLLLFDLMRGKYNLIFMMTIIVIIIFQASQDNNTSDFFDGGSEGKVCAERSQGRFCWTSSA